MFFTKKYFGMIMGHQINNNDLLKYFLTLNIRFMKTIKELQRSVLLGKYPFLNSCKKSDSTNMQGGGDSTNVNMVTIQSMQFQRLLLLSQQEAKLPGPIWMQ